MSEIFSLVATVITRLSDCQVPNTASSDEPVVIMKDT